VRETVAFLAFAAVVVGIGALWDRSRASRRNQAHQPISWRIEAWLTRHGWIATPEESAEMGRIDREIDERNGGGW
jgi:hypothetical protein